MDRDVDLVRAASHGLVDRVVHDLVDEMMEAPLADVADVHVRPLADRLHALQHLDRVDAIGICPVSVAARWGRALLGGLPGLPPSGLFPRLFWSLPPFMY